MDVRRGKAWRGNPVMVCHVPCDALNHHEAEIRLKNWFTTDRQYGNVCRHDIAYFHQSLARIIMLLGTVFLKYFRRDALKKIKRL